MPVGSVYKLGLKGTLYGQEVVTTYHYQQSSANSTGDSDMKKLADAFNQIVIPTLVACESEDVTWQTMEIRTVTAPSVPLAGIDAAVAGGTGTVEEAGVPPSVAVVVRRKTALLGRKYRGRVFVPAIPASWVTGGEVQGVHVSDEIDTFRAAIIQPIVHSTSGSPSFAPVIATREPEATGPVPGVRITPIIDGTVDPILRSQRRREIGVGA